MVVAGNGGERREGARVHGARPSGSREGDGGRGGEAMGQVVLILCRVPGQRTRAGVGIFHVTPVPA
jgi:hypothetical protein